MQWHNLPVEMREQVTGQLQVGNRLAWNMASTSSGLRTAQKRFVFDFLNALAPALPTLQEASRLWEWETRFDDEIDVDPPCITINYSVADNSPQGFRETLGYIYYFHGAYAYNLDMAGNHWDDGEGLDAQQLLRVLAGAVSDSRTPISFELPKNHLRLRYTAPNYQLDPSVRRYCSS